MIAELPPSNYVHSARAIFSRYKKHMTAPDRQKLEDALSALERIHAPKPTYYAGGGGFAMPVFGE
jgi:hypothetical protein